VRVRKLATAAALALTLALGLAPGLAQADDSAQQEGQLAAGQLVTQDAPTVDTVSDAIKTLPIDPSKITASDKDKVMGIKAQYDELSAADQKTIDETTAAGSNQSLGRVLESAVWATYSYDTNNSTTLPDGTYEGAQVVSKSNKGKSTSPRIRIWNVKNLTVKDGKATATLALTDGDGKPIDTQSAVWMGGKEYPCDAADKSLFPGVPVVMSGTTYFGGVSTTMPAPTMYSLTVEISNDVATATITGVSGSYYYTGEAITPTPVVMFGGKTLVADTDYTVTYAHNKEASLLPAATATIEGKGDYTGKAVKQFAIVKYTDVEGHWALSDDGHNWIKEATDKGLMSGYRDKGILNGKFGPDDNILRQDIAVMLYRSANPDSKATTDPEAYAKENTTGWEDCEGGQYYTAAMNWAKEAEVFTGDKATDYKTVRPGDSISRQELATVYGRYAKDTGKKADGSYKKAPDAGKVAEWAVEGIDWCYTNGVMTGNKETKALNPGDTATRAETAKMTVTTVNIKLTPANK